MNTNERIIENIELGLKALYENDVYSYIWLVNAWNKKQPIVKRYEPIEKIFLEMSNYVDISNIKRDKRLIDVINDASYYCIYDDEEGNTTIEGIGKDLYGSVNNRAIARTIEKSLTSSIREKFLPIFELEDEVYIILAKLIDKALDNYLGEELYYEEG